MLDLFGDVVVTQDDLNAWVSAVAPGFAISAIRRAHYIEHWNVADKVRRAKLDGYFDSTIDAANERRALLHRRFSVHAIRG